MPKQTFFNLAQEKRTALVEIAIEEFANHDYNTASISKIVERAGIAKGSIYQYFEDKEDMFLYFVEEASRRLLAELAIDAHHLENEDFFDVLRRQMSATIRVNLANPQLSRLLRRSSQVPTALREKLMKRLSATASNYFFQLIQRGIDQGELRPESDPMLLTVMLSGLLSELGNYIAAKLNLDPTHIATVDASVFASPIVETIYDDVITLLRHGFANPLHR